MLRASVNEGMKERMGKKNEGRNGKMGDGWTDGVTLLCDGFTVEIRAELGLEIRADLEKSKETRDCIPGREQNN